MTSDFFNRVAGALKADPVNYDLSKASMGLTKKILKEYNLHRPLGPQQYICHAPFKNIYFAHHGKIIACCYNRNYIIGNYPENSIRDIWFGQKANELRAAIKNNNLSMGCTGCLTQILAYNFDATKAKQYDQRKFNENNYPSVMEFELDNTCNLECVMCSGDFSSLIRANREKREPLKSPYDDNFLKQLKEFIPFLQEVKFYGGEPFLIETYYKIWEMIMEINPAMIVSVQTNATILNNRVKNILAKTNFHINVSLDSLQKKVYENIRVNANFNRVMENIDFFYEYCKERNTFFGVSACMMQDNWMEMPDFIRFCNDKGIPVYFHTVFFPLEKSIRSMDVAGLNKIIDYYESQIVNLPEAALVEIKNKKHLSDALNQVKGWLYLTTHPNDLKSKMRSIDDLITILHQRLNDKVGSYRMKKAIEILKRIEAELPEKYDFEAAFNAIDVNDDLVLENIVVDLETKPLSKLLQELRVKDI